MQLKRRLVGLRVPARGPGGPRKPSWLRWSRRGLSRRPCTSARCRPTAVAFGSAGVWGGGSALAWRPYSPGARQFGGDRGERCGPSHAAARADFGRLRPRVGRFPARMHCVQCFGTAEASRSWRHDNSRRGRWRPNGCIRPVLKHGPRSATCARVFGWQTPRRSESVSGTRFRRGESLGPSGRGRIVDRSRSTPWWDLSESVPVATRKMVNYA